MAISADSGHSAASYRYRGSIYAKSPPSQEGGLLL